MDERQEDEWRTSQWMFNLSRMKVPLLTLVRMRYWRSSQDLYLQALVDGETNNQQSGTVERGCRVSVAQIGGVDDERWLSRPFEAIGDTSITYGTGNEEQDTHEGKSGATQHKMDSRATRGEKRKGIKHTCMS
jgi:hypothetical protein